MATKTAPPEEPAPTAPDPEHRFFLWLRALDVPRQNGWVGGVCGGIAARLGIDPLIVRGIVVVIAVLGGPIALLYGIAWLLLPDQSGRIHLRELGHGRVNAALAGIGALIVLSLLPIAQGFWWAGARFWGAPAWGESVGRALWSVVLLGALAALVVWIARRAGGAPRPPRTAAAPAAPAAATTAPTVVPEGATAQPPSPAAGAPEEEFVEWRQRLEAWQAENAAFRAAQAEARAEERRLRSEANRAHFEAANARAVEARRIRRLTKPRLSAAWFFVIVGAAIIAGGIAALAASTDENWMGVPAAAGLAIATLVAGLGAVIVAALGRRSGALGLVTILLVLVTVPTAFIPHDRELLPASASGLAPGSYAQLAGSTYLDVGELDHGVVDLWQGAGSVTIWVESGASARIESTLRAGGVSVLDQYDDAMTRGTGLERVSHGIDDTWSGVVGSGTPALTVRIHSTAARVEVIVQHHGNAPTNGDN
jgi:phage shock protein PspC (stress-responsive transcriptional regulator)